MTARGWGAVDPDWTEPGIDSRLKINEGERGFPTLRFFGAP